MYFTTVQKFRKASFSKYFPMRSGALIHPSSLIHPYNSFSLSLSFSAVPTFASALSAGQFIINQSGWPCARLALPRYFNYLLSCSLAYSGATHTRYTIDDRKLRETEKRARPRKKNLSLRRSLHTRTHTYNTCTRLGSAVRGTEKNDG